MLRSGTPLEIDLLERFLSLNPDTVMSRVHPVICFIFLSVSLLNKPSITITSGNHIQPLKPESILNCITHPGIDIEYRLIVFEVDGAHEFEAKRKLEEKRKRDHERMQQIQQAGRGAGRGRGQRPGGTGKPQSKFRGREVTATLTTMSSSSVAEATKDDGKVSETQTSRDPKDEFASIETKDEVEETSDGK